MHEHSLSSVLRRTRIEVAYACEGIAAGRCCSGFKSVVVRYASLPNALMEHFSARVDLCRFKSIHVDDERRERSNVKYDGGFVATPNNSRDDQGALHHVSHAPPRMALLVAAAGAAFVLALTLYLAFAPTFTNDFWFHLKMGEVYWTLGPWRRDLFHSVAHGFLWSSLFSPPCRDGDPGACVSERATRH